MSRSRTDAEDDIRQSPIGFYNMGLCYIDAGDALAQRQLDPEDSFRLIFEAPIRHLYAHGWELCLKACLFQQGRLPSKLKKKPGHWLAAAWDAVDKTKFAALKLTPETRPFVEMLDAHHGTKLYSYPVVGFRQDFSIPYVRATSARLRLSRSTLIRLFGTSIHDLG